MSGKPSSGGVSEVIRLLGQLQEADETLAKQIPAREALAATITVAEAKRREDNRTLEALLREMDVDSSGNYGWAGRMGWFLGEFRRQLSEKVRQDVRLEIAAARTADEERTAREAGIIDAITVVERRG